MADTQDPKAIWESLTPAQRERVREALSYGTALIDFDEMTAMGLPWPHIIGRERSLGLFLLHSPAIDGWCVVVLTDLGRAVALAGQEVSRGR